MLVLLPFFTELEFLGFKFKKEIKEEIKEIKQQQMQMLSHQSIAFNFGSEPMSENKRKAVTESIKEESLKHGSANFDINQQGLNVDDKIVFLFQARFKIEDLVEKISYSHKYLDKAGSKPFALHTGLNRLRMEENISKDLYSALVEIVRICNMGVHGRSVSDEDYQFVKDNIEASLEQLELIHMLESMEL